MIENLARQGVFQPHLLISGLEANANRIVLHLPDGSSLTGRELADETSRYIAALKASGVDEHSRVALLSTNRVEVMHVMHATLIMGSLFTPLHPLGAIDDFSFIVDDAEIDVLIFDPKFEQVVKALRERHSGMKTLLSFGQTHAGQDLVAIAKSQLAAPLAHPELGGSEIFRLSYSGGTTGQPKASQSDHDTALAMTQIQMAEWEWPAEVRQLLVAPLSHTGGLMFLPTLLRGGSFYVIAGFEPVAVMEAIEKHKITCLLMVPTMIYALLDHPRFDEFDLSSLETIFYGASPMSVPRLQEGIRRFGPKFFQFYGQVECPMTITVMRKAEHIADDPERLASCGRPVPWVQVALLDSEGQLVADGTPGEICVRGPLCAPGYRNRPDLNADLFRNGWLHTGDIAIRNRNGFLCIVGRAKDMVITGGFNVYPREVEDVLACHPAVAAVGVFGTPDEHWGEMVTAAIVLRSGMDASADELALLVRQAKGVHQAPKRFHFLETLPLTPLGKPDKKALRRMFP